MEKEEKKNNAEQINNEKDMNKDKKVENKSVDKAEETKFNKVSGKDLKKETDMNKKIEKENKKTKKSKNKKENKPEKEKNNHKVGYWAGGIGLLIIVLVIVTALILLPNTPEKTVDGMLNSLKNGDFDSINKYVNYEEILNKSEILENTETDQEMQTLLFDRLSWKVLNIAKENDTASIEVEITNKDFDKIVSNYTQEALKIAFSGESFTEEDQKNKLKEQLQNEEIGTKTVTTTMNLNEQDGTWKVQVDDNLIDALLPGLQDAINSLNSIING